MVNQHCYCCCVIHTLVYYQIPNPSEEEVAAGRTTAYDTWVYNAPSATNPTEPQLVCLAAEQRFYKQWKFAILFQKD